MMMKRPEKKTLFHAMVFHMCTIKKVILPVAGLCATTGAQTEVEEAEEFWNTKQTNKLPMSGLAV
jgi:hypothetical protein